jgi:undecaprenyl diphosphate synthase
LWAFSTENWSRPEKEREVIFDLVLNTVRRFREDSSKDKIKFRFIGRRDRLPKNLISELLKLESETKNFNSITVVLCLDYGGRDEIVRAANKIIKSGIKSVDEKKFSEFLDTFGIPDVDLIIRTANEKRLSGFMPFQSVYSELYFAKPCFPDFGKRELKKAIEDFEKRKRNFGR